MRMTGGMTMFIVVVFVIGSLLKWYYTTHSEEIQEMLYGGR